MKARIVSNKELNTIAAGSGAPLLQSGHWSDFQEEAGHEAVNLAVFAKDKALVWGVLLSHDLPGGFSYLYCPRGPFAAKPDKKALAAWWQAAKNQAQERKAAFIRAEPADTEFLPDLQAKRSADIQPSKTLLVDLTQPEEALLKAMHQKTRYNIRLAKRKGVEVRLCQAGNHCKDIPFAQVWDLMSQTGDRNEFRLHGKEYYKKMLALEPIRLLAAFHKGDLLAIGFFSFFNKQAVYLHGASANIKRNLMAPYALQWEAMATGKRLGCKSYDFFGIDKQKWPGVTRFKKGFGGSEKTYPGTFDIIINKPYYYIYKIGRKIISKR